MTRQSAIVAEAMTWLDTPYHHRQRVKGAGVDCAQILIGVFVVCGMIADFEPEDYPRDWMMNRTEDRFRAKVRELADEISVAEVRPGDVALYRVGHCFAHGSVIIDWPLVLHADSRLGKVTLAEGDQGWLAERPVEFYRVRA